MRTVKKLDGATGVESISFEKHASDIDLSKYNVKTGNQYKPNGKGYGYDNGPYKVRVAWSNVAPYEHSSQLNATIGNILLMPNPSGATKADISFEDPVPHVVKVRSTNKNGWFMFSNEKTYYAKGKDQRDDDF